ncbi:MAG: hypothetical protein Q9188_003204 [Gyalolechia gomerana]
MSAHANQPLRCNQQDPRPEGISAEKMSLITSNWGATWADIYSVIFPGAPLPSPYHEYDPPEPLKGQSPQSQDVAEFDRYTQTELPLLVEANLQHLIAPLEEGLKAMLVDIVRRCHSTVAQNYNRREKTLSSDNPRSEVEPSDAVMSFDAVKTASGNQCTDLQHPEITGEGNELTNNDITNFFDEPRWLDPSLFGPLPEIDPSLSLSNLSDSGYRSWENFSPFCTCPSPKESEGHSNSHSKTCPQCGLERADFHIDSPSTVHQ